MKPYGEHAAGIYLIGLVDVSSGIRSDGDQQCFVRRGIILSVGIGLKGVETVLVSVDVSVEGLVD